MYMEIKRAYKCSKCGAVDDFEVITSKNECKRRCKSCGHEKTEWTISTYPTSGNEIQAVHYSAEDFAEPIEF